ncbi:protein translocase subunit SecF [Alteromonas sediminis]|uniref:Protein-export membrane protein SecF n=1 Tax=Alteromonas sediminis TaxID=2259342 RepID=A0A3N5Y089_9ALTE|nr:protein translocase subunit SecF [Alteromonas sediminis]RPJ66450.1 protein translocase subunit SecF [Alteromonas sediminis]
MTRFRQIGLVLAAVALFFSLIALTSKGLNYGIEFTGGVVTEFTASVPLTQNHLLSVFEPYIQEEFRINGSQDGMSWSIRQSDNSSIAAQREVIQKVAEENSLPIQLQESVFIGSQIGEELIEKGGLALLFSALCMMAYVTFRFEWRLASSAIFALLHDVFVVLGCFAWFQVRFDLSVLAGLLAIMGYSLNDSIIVGDRIRELLISKKHNQLNSLVNLAVKSTFRRTLITSGTTLATIIAIGLMAGDVLGSFALSLGIGVVVGTFSSIFVAATLPVVLGLGLDAYDIPDFDTTHGDGPERVTE